ncbi:MAG: hypothetical protein KAX49_03155 [Halanaerobiales bacterium]|nr:hypothetical protein [Halanaerobiales bacterium]
MINRWKVCKKVILIVLFCFLLNTRNYITIAEHELDQDGFYMSEYSHQFMIERFEQFGDGIEKGIWIALFLLLILSFIIHQKEKPAEDEEKKLYDIEELYKKLGIVENEFIATKNEINNSYSKIVLNIGRSEEALNNLRGYIEKLKDSSPEK